MKPFLNRHLYKMLTPEDILTKFLPTATITVRNTCCTIEYKNLKWSLHSMNKKECEENAVNHVLKTLFGIELVPLFFQDERELKRKLSNQILTAKNGNMFTSSLAVSKNSNLIYNKLIKFCFNSIKARFFQYRTKIQTKRKNER